MCGIAGVMMADGSMPDAALLDRLEKALLHRGPDGTGRYVRDGVGLVHARLAIIDLTSGDQPLFGPRGCALVANGEIYNYIELRERELPDADLHTRSDCEPILHLYDRHGTDAARHLRGMYAFALHDPDARSLTLARDPFGIKQLYYVETPRCFAFASEPQALIAAGLVDVELARRPAGELLQLQFTTGAETIFAGIRRLLPGETLSVTQGRITGRTMLAALPAEGPRPVGETDALRRLDDILMDSVNVHQRADVPYGLFLSSGIDSAAILTCMTRLNTNPVQAYTACFPKTGVHDEYDEAHKLAKAMGAHHVKIEVTATDFWRLLPKIVACVDDPTADYAIVPTYILAREAAKDLKVILCGEGGDEIFAGYGRYRRQIRPWWLGGRQRRRTGPFSGRGILYEEPKDWRDGIVAAEAASALPGRSKLQIAQAADCVDWLAHGLLVKLDRCLMAHGLEGRTPLLDPVVGDFGFCLPEDLKLARGRGKYLMRRWLEEHVPNAPAFARKKGFTVPVGDWIATQGEKLGLLVANDPAIQAIASADAVKAAFSGRDRHTLEAAWRLLFFALWHRRHIRGIAPDGDVFECLAHPLG
ncbi:asparagine synthase (glutamine-hydrolyzing) [Telmatospirillum sp.]|uniref:asparagine synthase (glutamine-hydrolyzing) n=1 Tax=Telmatospirillum sp. TaxID=2079197 RepID=UPI00283C8E9F|nr:asparagine synthase (glutamine-hydrolyzing) [Telmatospirillum sp.]MDR3436337.1 asparagine synthase (glutamine-hydrolyzing) [Telmatospirillum sp.]